jgi:hypothetical protein
MAPRMNILLIVMALAAAKDSELDDFIGRDVKIYFTSFPEYYLGMDEESRTIMARNKHADLVKHKFITRAKLYRAGSRYSIMIGDSFMCKNGNSVVTCRDQRQWDISRKPFGYTMSTEGKCITKDADEAVKMSTCVNTEDQLFDFKPADADACGDLEDIVANGGSNPEHITNVNIRAGEAVGTEKKTIKLREKHRPGRKKVINEISSDSGGVEGRSYHIDGALRKSPGDPHELVVKIGHEEPSALEDETVDEEPVIEDVHSRSARRRSHHRHRGRRRAGRHERHPRYRHARHSHSGR